MAQGPSKDQWELWGTIAGVLVVAYAVIRWPLWWTFQRIVCMALEKEIAQVEKNTAAIKAQEDILVTIRAVQDTQGVALREIPRMSGLMEQMTSAIDRLDGTLQTMASQQLDHGKELGRVTGFIEAEGWRGPERRKRGRRTDDPPLEDSHDP